MAIDSTDLTAAETKLDTAIAADQASTIRDAIGNEISYQRPSLKDLREQVDWAEKKATSKARTSMFDKFKFAERGD